MSSMLDRVWKSYQHCIEDYAFLHDFYLNFTQSSPEVSRHFANTDMDHQVIMLRASLELLLGGERTPEEQQVLDQVANIHSRHGVGIPPQLYDCWLESLLSTVQHYDLSFDSELEQAWRDALEPGINHMKAAY